MIRRLIPFLLFLLIGTSTMAQFKDHKKVLKTANKFFKANQFEKALDLYLKIYADSNRVISDEDFVNYHIGICYFASARDDDKLKAVRFFKKCIESGTHEFDVANYQLAQLYHYFYRFDEAIAHYELAKISARSDTMAPWEHTQEILKDIDREIQDCNYGKVFIKNPIDVVVENLGHDINTINSEYAPVIAPDETKLVFTRRSPESLGGKISFDGDYFEDIFITEILEGSSFQSTDLKNTGNTAGYQSSVERWRFSPVRNLVEINTKGHEGAVQFSYDHNHLYVYKNSNIWKSTVSNGKWGALHKIPGMDQVMHPKSFEPSVSISFDGTTVYMSSDRKGGYGGLDIYKSHKNEDGTWTEPENMGAEINTSFDEDGPYIDPDGTTLYFSSKGHSSMGSYDVFKSKLKDGKWEAPQNMGYPVNSTGDDIFYMMTPRFNRAYYSSNKPGGKGKMDIYRLTFANERPPLAEVKGLVLSGDSMIPAFSKLKVTSAEDNFDFSEHQSDSTSGEYLLLFAHGKKYNVEVYTDGFAPYKKDFTIPPGVRYYQFYQEIHHVHIKDKMGRIIGQKVTVQNAISRPKIPDSLQFHPGMPDDLKLRAALPDSIRNNKALADSLLEDLVYLKNLVSEINMKDSLEFESAMNSLMEADSNLIKESSEMVDVKFFIPEDSLRSLIAEDTTISIDIPVDADVAFVDEEFFNDTVSFMGSLEAFQPVEKVKPKQLKVLKTEITDTSNTAESAVPLKPASFKLGDYLNLVKETRKSDSLALADSDTSSSGIHENIESIKEEFIVLEDSTSQESLSEQMSDSAIVWEEVPKVVVFFDYKGVTLTDDAKSKLNVFIEFIKKNDYKFEIHGHTDNVGSSQYNADLSLRRASMVKNYFLEMGITKIRLAAIGKGEDFPISPNNKKDGSDNPEGRALNRRVEFKLITDF